MDGLLLLNKPNGITSFDCIRRLRQNTGVKKIGHAGTLDPQASGLMLMLFGTATKQAQRFSKLDKEYEAEVTLGCVSSTGDKEGELKLVSKHAPDLTKLEQAVSFTGDVSVAPPVYSAIKIGGQEAYKRARRGEKIEMPVRLMTVRQAELMSYEYPIVKLRWTVSSGTYVRSLAERLGDELGTGAYLSGLVRTKVGEYELGQAVELDQVDLKTDLLPV